MSAQITADIVIIGAGIAGAGLAAALGRDLKIVIVEREARPGYHSTGRSAALFIRNYGNSAIRALTAASAPLFANADPEYFPVPLLSPRGILFVADDEAMERHERELALAAGITRITPEEAGRMVPLLNVAWIAAAAYEADAMDIDVSALHQGWLSQARAAGARLMTNAPVTRGVRRDGSWQIEAGAWTVSAPIVVNAAGAWADMVAQACGVPPVGLTPRRRTIAVLPEPPGYACSGWPSVSDSGERWYFKPQSGRLLVSPADEDPVEPQDVQVDDMVLAEGLHRYEQAVRAPVTRVERSWAGLRTFAPDRSPVVGPEPLAEGFFWLAGQGGYGIHTSPALSALAAALVMGSGPDAALAPLTGALSPERFSGRGGEIAVG